jgi:transcriptional regulator GlxA family with amidase domain
VHKVAILALPGFVAFDLGIPCEVFGSVKTASGKRAYSVRVCTHKSEAAGDAFRLRSEWRLEHVAAADTVIIPGIANPFMPIPQPVINAIKSAWKRGARIASICSGAFVLAATGLLDGRRATTHWIGTKDLARLYPKINVDADVLFVDEGRIVTSAGASAGLDMCLYLVRLDHGQATAAHAARLAVAPLDREGGQSQFIKRELPGSESSLAPLLNWMQQRLDAPLDIPSLAARAKLSERTFARRFREQTGTTPLQWVIAARIRIAQELLETTRVPIDRIAAKTGFESAVTFRKRFQRLVGVSPSLYRRQFNGNS